LAPALAAILALAPSAHAAFPGANGKIAFDDGDDAMGTINPDGSGETYALQGGFAPHWSPDGAKIAYYQTDADGIGRPHVINPDWSNDFRVGGFFDYGFDAAWSPDKSKLVFQYDGVNIVNPDPAGSERGRIVRGTSVGPQWSPNGAKIVYEKWVDFDHRDIWTVSPDGAGATNLTNDLTAFHTGPDWSPDGTKIVYTADRDHNGTHTIWVMNADGSAKTEVTTATSYDVAWSPDGTKIAYAGHDFQIHVINADGSADTVVPTLARVSLLDWQPVLPSGTAGLSISKASSPSPVRFGDSLTYTLMARNIGPATATGVVVSDSLPPNVSFGSVSSSQGSCTHSSGTVTCNLGSIADQGSATVTITVVPQNTQKVTNTATISGDQVDSNPRNNTTSVSTKVYSYEVPQTASQVKVSLVPLFRQCGVGSSPVNGGHSPPLGTGACLPPVPNSNVARLGPTSTGSFELTVLPGPPAAIDGTDVRLIVSISGVQTLAGGAYNPSAGADLTAVARVRVTDLRNCGPSGCTTGYDREGTATEYDLAVPIQCRPTSGGSLCDWNQFSSFFTIVGELSPGYQHQQAVVQLFRVRIYDSGANGVRENGGGDDRILAHQGIYIP
jgi:uncharacterized repeat protein (TIGR01451 family)